MIVRQQKYISFSREFESIHGRKPFINEFTEQFHVRNGQIRRTEKLVGTILYSRRQPQRSVHVSYVDQSEEIFNYAKDSAIERPPDDVLRPLLLFRGNLSFGRAQILWAFAQTCYKMSIPRFNDMNYLRVEIPDAAHVCGLHPPKTLWYGRVPHGGTAATMRHYLGRIVHAENFSLATPALKDYIYSLFEHSGVPLIALTPIDEGNIRSHRSWRREVAGRLSRAEREANRVPSIYPFLSAISSEHDLLMAVHNCVPKRIPEDVRQDVCQDLLVSVLSGEVALGNLQDAVPKYIKKVFGEHPLKYQFSLDAPIWADSNRTWADILRRPSAEDEYLDQAELVELEKSCRSFVAQHVYTRPDHIKPFARRKVHPKHPHDTRLSEMVGEERRWRAR